MVSPSLKRRRGREGLYMQDEKYIECHPRCKVRGDAQGQGRMPYVAWRQGTKEAFLSLHHFLQKEDRRVKHWSAESLYLHARGARQFNQAIKRMGIV
jgi:hypothetical protein